MKTIYGAVGDGVADDTSALQTALNSLGQAGRSPVLYLPAGTYRVTAGLTLSGRQGISIIGEDPARTTIKWDGAVNGEILYLNGVSYSRFGRITWDGAGKALAGVDHGWDGLGTQGGGTYNEHADEVFQNFTYGIRGGSKGFMDAETAVLRCQFLRNTRAGVSIESYNALDWYIWDSTFTGNYIGVTNMYGAGNFHVRGSLFQSSTKADIAISSVSFFSIRQNFSIGSNAFFTADKIGSSSAQITLQSNTILDPITQPIVIYNPGPVLMFDNVIRSSAGQTGPVVTIQDVVNQSPGELVAVGNTFTVANWNSVSGTLTDIDNQVVSRSTVNPATPTIAGALPNLNRQIFEVPAGASADGIQSAIDAAAAVNGQRPVVHLAAGVYSLNRAIVIPSGSDVQLVGDGGGNAGATHLQWQGARWENGHALRLLFQMTQPFPISVTWSNDLTGSASREKFDSNRLTAAHRELPLNFHGRHNINQYAIYITDAMKLGNFTINAGLRIGSVQRSGFCAQRSAPRGGFIHYSIDEHGCAWCLRAHL